ncbi:MAG: transporter substrate-binding domain-containing protein [Eubacterium sp.]|nr:transporter substrate-binding domain-containing protein [Eubacterium sp.]
MKKRTLGVLLTLALAGGVLAGCGSSSQETTGSDTASSTSETTADESGRTQLIVGFDAEYPPYGYMDDDGEYTGFDLELAQAVCDMEGWELVKQPIDWSSKDGELNGGSIDCIWNGFTMNGKEDDYEWSDAYVNNEQVIVVAKDSGIESLSDLAGKIVGVQQASAALDVLTNEDYQKELGDTFAEMQQFGDYNVAFTELTTGSLDAVAMDVGVAQYQLEERGEGKYMILEEALNSEQYGIGFKLGNTSLRDVVNEDLHKLAQDGTVAELAEKYGIADMICIE